MEVSIDEPLNVDWDGNELLLSDILGTDEDIIYRDMEDEVEKKLLKKAIRTKRNPNKLVHSCTKTALNPRVSIGTVWNGHKKTVVLISHRTTVCQYNN